jgi:hypothetical protein
VCHCPSACSFVLRRLRQFRASVAPRCAFPHATSSAGSISAAARMARALVRAVPHDTNGTGNDQTTGWRSTTLPCSVLPLPPCISRGICILSGSYEFLNAGYVHRSASHVAHPVGVRRHPASSTSCFLRRRAVDHIVEVSLVQRGRPPGRSPQRASDNGTQGRPPSPGAELRICSPRAWKGVRPGLPGS